MSYYKTSQNARVMFPNLDCDSCQRFFSMARPFGLGEVVRMRVDPDPLVRNEIWLVPDYISMEPHVVVDAAHQAGWRREIIHGKAMDFCPQCAAKDLVSSAE